MRNAEMESGRDEGYGYGYGYSYGYGWLANKHYKSNPTPHTPHTTSGTSAEML